MTPEILVFITAALTLTAGCLVPNRWLPARMPNDKLMHFAAYFVLALLALHIAAGSFESLLWLAGLLFASWLIECLQKLVPDRNFSWPDMVANAAGIAVAALCAAVSGSI